MSDPRQRFAAPKLSLVLLVVYTSKVQRAHRGGCQNRSRYHPHYWWKEFQPKCFSMLLRVFCFYHDGVKVREDQESDANPNNRDGPRMKLKLDGRCPSCKFNIILPIYQMGTFYLSIIVANGFLYSYELL